MSSSYGETVYSRTFVEWYCDDSIPGHTLLEPSIFVGRSYKRIFSPLKTGIEACEACNEILIRAILVLALPVIVAVCLVLVPFGLIVKGVADCCMEPIPRMPLPDIEINNKTRIDAFSRKTSGLFLDDSESEKDQQSDVDSSFEFLTPDTEMELDPISSKKGQDQKGYRTQKKSDDLLDLPQSSGKESNFIDLKEKGKLSESSSDSETSSAATRLSHQPKKRVQSSNPKVQKAEATLNKVEELLRNIKLSAINDSQIKRAERYLQRDAYLHHFENPSTTKKSSNKNIETRYFSLKNWIESLKQHKKYVEKRGVEIEVSGEGDCLFSACIAHLSLREKNTTFTAQEEREKTIKWIRKNYKSKVKLQRHLINSMAEHYHQLADRLQQDHNSLSKRLARQSKNSSKGKKGEGGDLENIRKKIVKVERQNERLLTEIIPKITLAYGEKNEGIHFEYVESLIPAYLKEMSQPGAYAGMAELYAMSCRHEVSIHIYAKQGETGVSEKPYKKLNTMFNESAPIYLTHTQNHFNAYCPPRSSSNESASVQKGK